ncbi:uncharacterized [Tachysurus ichikawai]
MRCPQKTHQIQISKWLKGQSVVTPSYDWLNGWRAAQIHFIRGFCVTRGQDKQGREGERGAGDCRPFRSRTFVSITSPCALQQHKQKDTQPNECLCMCEPCDTRRFQTQFQHRQEQSCRPSAHFSCSTCLLTRETRCKESCDTPLWLQNNPAWC